MLYFGGLPPLISAGILIAYSMVLGLYFAALGLLLTATAKAFRGAPLRADRRPFFWVALELLSARFTKVPWDLLGYSQIDNFLLTSLAPFTGVYGITFVLIAGNALIAWGLLASTPKRRITSSDKWLAGGAGVAERRSFCSQPRRRLQATAVLLQQNLNVNQDNSWPGDEYEEHLKPVRQTQHPHLRALSCRHARTQSDFYPVTPDCPAEPVAPGIIVWPESPAPFHDKDPRLLNALHTLALSMDAPVIAGTTSFRPTRRPLRYV